MGPLSAHQSDLAALPEAGGVRGGERLAQLGVELQLRLSAEELETQGIGDLGECVADRACCPG
ncbi:MAG: hypothetical protein JOZ09_16865 [Pseudonocardiales bacterium]|nr:hypothetical protein [Pseudonocardiales bacterium]